MTENLVPDYLYKIVSNEQWKESLVENRIPCSEMDSDFIHMAKEDQIANVVQKFWSGQDHIILKISVKKLVGRLVYETNPGKSTKYYHLYEGYIPLDAVKDVTIVNIWF